MCSARMRNGILPMLFNGLWDKTKKGDDKVCNPFVPRLRRSFIEWRGESSFSEWRQRMNWVDNQSFKGKGLIGCKYLDGRVFDGQQPFEKLVYKF